MNIEDPGKSGTRADTSPASVEKYDQSFASEGHRIDVVSRSWNGMLVSRRRHVGGTIASYVQPALQVSVVLHGSTSVELSTGGIVHHALATKGAVWLMPPGLEVDHWRLGPDPIEVVHLYPDLERLCGYELASGVAERIELRLDAEDPLIEQVGRAIAAELEKESSVGTILVESLSRVLAARLVHVHASHLGFRLPSRRGGLDRRRLERAVDYIEVNLDKDLTLENVASLAHLSPFHFARTFRISTGWTLRKYVSMRRLLLSKAMLEKGQLSLAEIACALSLSSPESFAKAFRRAVGLSPGLYRKRHRGAV